MRATQAYILVSGGMDSTTLLLHAIAQFGKVNVHAMSVDYGQRHQKEILIGQQYCKNLGIPHRFLDLSGVMGKGGLTDDDLDVPEVPYSELTGVSPTFVPFRNGLMLAAITSHAVSQCHGDEEAVVGFGAHAEDAENWAYPDCTPEFIGAMANAIYVGTYHKVRLYTPLMWMTKEEIGALGTQYDIDWSLTWSCYKGEEMQCGICSTCLARREALEHHGDNTEYAA